MLKLDLEVIPQTNATGYPAPFHEPVAVRWYRRLAPVGALSEMGASHVTLMPGAWSSQRHWHEGEDELLVMLAGEAVLVEDGGRTIVHARDVCAWPKSAANGHHLINESDAPCVFVAISAGPDTGGRYSDMMSTADNRYVNGSGAEYPRRGGRN